MRPIRAIRASRSFVLDGDGRMAREQGQRFDVGAGEAARRQRPNAEEPDHPLAPKDRDPEHGILSGVGVERARDVAVPLEHNRLTVAQYRPGEHKSGFHLRPQLARRHPVDGLGAHHVPVLVYKTDGAAVRSEQVTGALDDAREEKAQFQFAADRLDDRAQAFLLAKQVMGGRERGGSCPHRTTGSGGYGCPAEVVERPDVRFSTRAAACSATSPLAWAAI